MGSDSPSPQNISSPLASPVKSTPDSVYFIPETLTHETWDDLVSSPPIDPYLSYNSGLEPMTPPHGVLAGESSSPSTESPLTPYAKRRRLEEGETVDDETQIDYGLFAPDTYDDTQVSETEGFCGPVVARNASPLIYRKKAPASNPLSPALKRITLQEWRDFLCPAPKNLPLLPTETYEATSMNKQNDQESCPITEILMKSPNVLESSQTFEATSVEMIKDACNQRLPTGSDLFPEAALIPSRKVKKLVAKLGPGFYTPTTSPSSSDEKPVVSVDNLKHLLALLEKLPCSSVSEEIIVLKKLRLFVTRSPAVRTLLGQLKGAFNKLLNPTSVERSYSDASLQDVLVTVVLEITSDEDNGKKIVQECPNVMPFLITCLRSKTTDTRRFATVVIRGLSFQLDLNIRTVIGESGVIKPLIELIEEGGDPEALINAGSALLNLCRVSENRERAVSEGAVIAVMDKVVGRVLVERMLQTLEMLSRNEKAIAEMEKCGMLQCLFTILGEDIRDNGKEYCVTIIHTMCHANSATKMIKLINEVENARETLARVASTGTAKAKVKASELLLKLDSVSIGND